MAKPNSRTTRIRQWLVDRIQPYPAKGEGWCIGCSFKKGQTQILPENALQNHVRSHVLHNGPQDYVRIITHTRKGHS